MLPLLAAAAPILGAVAGGLLQNQGARETNAANAKQAENQMAFQERMSSTAHQREVADLKAAGLNPLLSLGGAGSSTPAGASAQMENPNANLGSMISTSARESYSAYLQQQKQKEEISLMKSQKNKTDTEEKVISKGIPGADIKNKLYENIGKPVLDKLIKATSSGPKTNTERKFDNFMRKNPNFGRKP